MFLVQETLTRLMDLFCKKYYISKYSAKQFAFSDDERLKMIMKTCALISIENLLNKFLTSNIFTIICLDPNDINNWVKINVFGKWKYLLCSSELNFEEKNAVLETLSTVWFYALYILDYAFSSYQRKSSRI